MLPHDLPIRASSSASRCRVSSDPPVKRPAVLTESFLLCTTMRKVRSHPIPGPRRACCIRRQWPPDDNRDQPPEVWRMHAPAYQGWNPPTAYPSISPIAASTALLLEAQRASHKRPCGRSHSRFAIPEHLLFS